MIDQNHKIPRGELERTAIRDCRQNSSNSFCFGSEAEIVGLTTLVLLSTRKENHDATAAYSHQKSAPWNQGKITGKKLPLKRNEIWAVLVRLHIRGRVRDLAPFNLAIDSKLLAHDLVSLRVLDVTQANQVAKRAIVMQSRTKQPVQSEITDQTGLAIERWIESSGLESNDYLFPSRKDATQLPGCPYLYKELSPIVNVKGM